jgi:signal transduction histidine kinase
MQTVSHELRTPLNSILGFTDVLWEEIDGPLNAAQKEDLAIIRNAGNHLMSLFNDVLDLSAAASGHLQLEFELVDVPALLEAVSSELGGLRRDRPVTVRSEAATGLPAVPADPKRLRQIVTNLGSNALKFTEQGEVVLGARLDGGWLRIEVRDTGPGIPPDEMSTVFEEFGQTVAEGKRRRGAGLGLAITRQLAELHGGEVSAESAPGEGSTFFVWLPLGQAHVGAA